jgi:hypothetical protein
VLSALTTYMHVLVSLCDTRSRDSTYVFKTDRLFVVGTAEIISGHLDGLLLGDLGSRRGNAVRLDETGTKCNHIVVLVECCVRDGVRKLDAVVLLTHIGNGSGVGVSGRGDLDGLNQNASLFLDKSNGGLLDCRASTLG